MQKMLYIIYDDTADISFVEIGGRK
jgi:hypothetical protein